jgi:tetratricopeptide (TPR) repeat protein
VLIVTVFGLTLWLRHTIIRMDPQFFHWSVPGVRGLVSYVAGDYAQAARAYRSHLAARVAKGLSTGDPGLDALLLGDPAGAERLARASLSARPDNIDALLTLADVALERSDPTAAVAAIEQILRQEPEQTDALLLSVVALARIQRYGDAMAVLNRALAETLAERRFTSMLRILELAGQLGRQPRSERPACLLATIHRYLRTYDPAQGGVAVRYAEQAIATGDHPADAYLTIGIVDHFQGRDEASLLAFLKAIELESHHAEALRWAAWKYADRGDVVNQARMATAAFEAAPGEPRYLRLVAFVLLEKLGDAAETVRVAQIALAYRPGDAVALSWLGQAHAYMGEHEPAVEAFRQSVAIAPRAAEFDRLGYSLYELHRLDEAVAAYNQALALEPQRRESHRLLAMAYREAGRRAEAIAQYEAALAGANSTAGQLLPLCEAYHGFGDYGRAVPCYRAVLEKDPGNFRAQLSLPIVLHGLQQQAVR